MKSRITESRCFVCGKEQIEEVVDNKFPLCKFHANQIEKDNLEIMEKGSQIICRIISNDEVHTIKPWAERIPSSKINVHQALEDIINESNINNFKNALEQIGNNWRSDAQRALAAQCSEVNIKVWLTLCKIVHSQAQRRNLKEVAEYLGYEYSYVKDLSYVWGQLNKSNLFDQKYLPDLKPSYYIQAARSDDPVEALEWIQEKKNVGERYSVRLLKKHIKQKKLGVNIGSQSKDLGKEGDQLVVVCTHCKFCKKLSAEGSIQWREPFMENLAVDVSGINVKGKKYCSRLKKPLWMIGDLYGRAEECRQNGYYKIRGNLGNI